MGKDEQKKSQQLLQNLFDSSDSFEFRQPVDWKTYELFEYPVIIKKPMDLGTVRKTLNNGMYETVEDCLRDIYLVWDNCKTFNKENQVIYTSLSFILSWRINSKK
jgi:hypothetical protein